MKSCSVIGLGYIGLPTAVLIANSGIKVTGVDINKKIIDLLNKGDLHIIEPNLKEKVNEAFDSGNFKVQTNLSISDVFLIAVPTPTIENEFGHLTPNIEYVLNAAKSIARVIKKGNLVILESTSPLGTTEKVENLISKESNLSKDQFNIAYCPERVIPGRTLFELVHNDRVIGGIDKQSSYLAKGFYGNFCEGEMHITNSKTAELVKLAENSFRDINIAFANEISIICEKFSIDPFELISLANKHPRVNILKPGCGVGGHCIAVDPWFIINSAPEITKLIKQARYVNDKKPEWVVNKLLSEALTFEKTYSKKPTIGCLGLTFKPDIDDMRESPALEIVQKLMKKNINVLCCEPNISKHDFIELQDIETVLESSDIVAILVAHKEFKKIKFKNNLVFDICGINYLK